MYVKSICVDMGVPVLSSSLEIGSFFVTPVSMGNPHAVCFVPNSPSEYPVEKWGPFLECHPQLGERSNVEFVQIVSHNKICLRIWERGSKETLSCGTGACAAAVCAIQQKGMENKVLAEVPGGTLTISWNGNGEAVFLSGPAEFICDACFNSLTNKYLQHLKVNGFRKIPGAYYSRLTPIHSKPHVSVRRC
ncbi:MAG: diaminopimelate epimerase [Lachnospiraceae bacterium]